MITVKSFCFNSFEENTYVLSDPTGECVIIDPGCMMQEEEVELAHYIDGHHLRPVRLLNTHCHIDHILGNQFVASRYQLGLEIHNREIPVLASSEQVSKMYQIALNPSPQPTAFLVPGQHIKFGASELQIFFTPGHSPGSVSFFSESDQFVISGDVLFERSIGRTDLPGGNYDTLIESIVKELLPLGDDVVVYSGHGNPTTIGSEKRLNPFLREHVQNF
ncbi:MAG: MBL fold metallo-hydrolase [Bacteroidia bacterium]|nr:MBL fold metallo-hydrolase [Bacteroidota bacterium]MBK8414035.1 MBL fold metallo-hydrolase [Bacteroidota bacterium]MBK9424446.1 MBL fold metallo-hydrolase [Bacteroidota bacterium]MBP9083037.1 MBL fold metallo-hydrolase [Bacteroidia bacterium]